MEEIREMGKLNPIILVVQGNWLADLLNLLTVGANGEDRGKLW